MKLPKALNEATAGAALKYHIKRALERSHSISEFSKNLELSAQKSHFSNNTLKIIEELNNGVKSASEEIKEKATKYEKVLQELQKIDESKLSKEQKQVLKVFKGELDQTEIKGINLNDLYILEQGTRHAGAKKILVKHYGEESTGGLTNDELINMSEVIKNGSVLLESFERLKNGFKYAYEWENNGVKLRLVVDDLNNGNKIFDFYSDRNFKDFRDASLHSGNHPYEPNPTPKPLTDQEDLLKTSENLNENTPNAKNLSPLEQAEAEKLVKLEHAITPLKEFGKNYPEFALKPKEALEKLLQEKNGQVAGAAFREDLGGIDFVWGTPKTKESNGYGLAHILEKREKQYKRLGLTNKQAKERTKELLKQIPEVIEKGIKDNDYIGHATIRHNGIEVGLSSQKGNTPLKNHYMITSFEIDEKVLRELKTIGTLSNNYRDGINYSTSNLNNPNPTTNALKTQEPLSEQANAKKLIKLESEKGIKAEALKKLNFDEVKKLIDESPNNGKDIIVIGDDNLTPDIVEYIHKKHAKVGIERLDEDEITAFNFTYPKNAKAIIDYQGIQHALNKHGINSPRVKFSKQPSITYKDIANYRDIVKNADETIKRDNRIISYKQVNGHFVVVEQINRNKSEFIFKTMFKEKGDYKNTPDYKKNIREND
ncbi:DUF3519 domain-containing protein [Helicobacter pylori]|uniref:DUF3519 domain-containing protein n=1 Tax=Helicobacter pylori TaxID=210 RepID=UPI000FDD1A31|nr:DUF3519 domain-containing protein [Helicobacter pylori]RVZ64678.1 DUF3519 domain-containing protein [Helicobacter pylori]